MKPIFMDYTLKDPERLEYKKDEYNKVWKRVSATHQSKEREDVHRIFLEKVYELETGPQSFDKNSNAFRSMFPEYFCDDRYGEVYPAKKPIGQPLLLPDDFSEMVKSTIDTYIEQKNKELPKGGKLTYKNLKEDHVEDLLVKFHELTRLFLKPKDRDEKAEEPEREYPLNLAMQPVLKKYSDKDKCDIFAFLFASMCKAAGINAKAAWETWGTDHWECRVFSPRNGEIIVDWPGGIRLEDNTRLSKISKNTRRSLP